MIKMPGIMIESDDVCLFVTESCNSNCIMCPMSLDSRKRGNHMSAEQWQQIRVQIPQNTPHITVTGGEPFLEHTYLIPTLEYISSSMPDTDVLILTNGRILSIHSIFENLMPTITERFCFAIPIHAANTDLHDQITQSPGSFSQSIAALRMLKSTPAKIEIRIVAHQLNLNEINSTIRMLVDSGLRISVINIIAMEITGCAARNRSQLWVDYHDICKSSAAGINYAVRHAVPIGLYNFPLCCVPHEFWPLVKESITPSKVRYYDECKSCNEYTACGGLFYSTFGLGLCKISPITGGKK